MNHLLDNPIFHALNTEHQSFAHGNEDVKYYIADVAPFAGLKDNSADNFEILFEMSPPESVFVVFTPVPYQIPKGWKLLTHIDMFQMVYDHSHMLEEVSGGFDDLDKTNVDEMIELVKLTQPGPFKSRTIDLGNYTGVFSEEKLVSMAGHRFHPSPYIEISAVCTHPDHVGKGYAYRLLNEQIKRILAKAQTPFLHVRNDNVGAIKLYQKLGLKIRTEMLAYVLRKEL
jgi:ribosomal protein S18 acetylase RimI-like enzyme